MPAKPMLDDVELQQVQKVEAEDEEVLAQHGVPALEGDFLQDLGRRVTRFTLIGVMTGPEAGEKLKTLRLKFRNAEPVTFVADIATATAVGKVLIEEFGVRELAGKPARFEYELTLREFLPAPPPEQEEPPPPPVIPIEPVVDTGVLIVEVIVEGDPNFDFSKVILTVEGKKDDGTDLNQTLTTRVNNVWTEDKMPPGQFTAKAVVKDPPEMSGSAAAAVRPGATTRVTITLRKGAIIATAFVVHFRFDNAFLEPCMREVLKQVADFADANKDAKLLITGNTDEVGTPGRLTDPDPYNQSLSERRARGVFGYLTFGTDAAAALKDWNALRQAQGALPTLGDKWNARQYQYMLQALGFYPGVVDGEHGPLTDDAVRSFREAKALPPGTTVDDAVWEALIEDYLKQEARKVPGAFLPNVGDACNSGILKWLGLATQDPVKNVPTAWRPNRRVELLFVKVEKLPCPEPQPDTFDKPAPGDVNATWCLGPGDKSKRTCFVVKHLPPGAAPAEGQFTRQPAEPGSITVSGTIKFEDGTPAGNVRYILIAPDGEFMDGEKSNGTGVEGRTKADGTFAYATKKGIGIYTLEIQDQLVARLEGEPQSAAKGNVVCKRMDGSTPFNVVVRKLQTLVNPLINLASAVVVVKKTYTNPARQIVTLTTDGPFFRSGTVTRVGAAIRFFDAAVNGTEITFNGTDNVFTGAQLSAGVKLFAEGATPSVALDDVVLTLTLSPGATPIGPPANATMTSVELTLDVALSRVAAGVAPPLMPQPPAVTPAPGTATDKFNLGRFVEVRDPGFTHERAMLVIQPPNPPAFAGTLLLTPINAQVQAFAAEGPAAGQLPVTPMPFPVPNPIPPGGTQLFVEGTGPSNAARETGFQLGIATVEPEGDRVSMTAVQIEVADTAVPAVAAATFVRMGLWDGAFQFVAPPGPNTLFNTNVEANNFAGADSRRFHLRVRDAASRTADHVNVDWRTLDRVNANLDNPANNFISLLPTPANSGVFISLGLLLVTDDADRDQRTHHGLAAAIPQVPAVVNPPDNLRARGESNHRVRRGSMFGDMVVEYKPAAGQVLPLRLPVFQRTPNFRRNLPLQIFVLRVAAGGNGVISTAPGAPIWTRDLRIIREAYERIGISMSTVVDAGSLGPNVVTFQGDSIVLLNPPGPPFNGALLDQPDEVILGNAITKLANTVCVFYVANLKSTNRGESFTDANALGTALEATAFINVTQTLTGPYSPVHEIGHLLTDKSALINGGHFNAPALPAGNRLTNDQNLMRNATSQNEGVMESKRLWDNADQDAVNQFNRIRVVPSRFIRA
jgi:outer membrane protein OmpA-like peptidoglycan-associated protein